MPRARKFAARVKALNAEYAGIAAQHGVSHVDLYPLLDDGTGELRKELSNDRLHLLGAGYEIWRDAISGLVTAA
jgi:lysophospholipase L1-like esterase